MQLGCLPPMTVVRSAIMVIVPKGNKLSTNKRKRDCQLDEPYVVNATWTRGFIHHCALGTRGGKERGDGSVALAMVYLVVVIAIGIAIAAGAVAGVPMGVGWRGRAPLGARGALSGECGNKCPTTGARRSCAGSPMVVRLGLGLGRRRGRRRQFGRQLVFDIRHRREASLLDLWPNATMSLDETIHGKGRMSHSGGVVDRWHVCGRQGIAPGLDSRMP